MVRQMRMYSLLIVLLLVLGGCQNGGDAVAELPTLAVLPSLTPSHTPTNTPTHTPTAPDTPTQTPTATFVPSATFTATITPTNTVTPPPTSTPTATLTLTATLTNTPDTPQIITFTASSDSVSGGQPVTLTWATVADNVRIDQLNIQGAVVQSFPVAASGDLTVTIPADQGGQVIYRLVALRGGQQTTRSLAIIIRCPIPWFFGENPVPNSGCPTAVGAVGPGAYQGFERGMMIYVNANGLNRIYGLQNDGSRYISYTNNWNGAALNFDPAPSGLAQPQDVFRWAFLNTNAPVGTWLNAIGWATTNIDAGQRTIQFEANGAFYINTPTNIIRFSGGDIGTWQLVR